MESFQRGASHTSPIWLVCVSRQAVEIVEQSGLPRYYAETNHRVAYADGSAATQVHQASAWGCSFSRADQPPPSCAFETDDPSGGSDSDRGSILS